MSKHDSKKTGKEVLLQFSRLTHSANDEIWMQNWITALIRFSWFNDKLTQVQWTIYGVWHIFVWDIIIELRMKQSHMQLSSSEKSGIRLLTCICGSTERYKNVNKNRIKNLFDSIWICAMLDFLRLFTFCVCHVLTRLTESKSPESYWKNFFYNCWPFRHFRSR